MVIWALISLAIVLPQRDFLTVSLFAPERMWKRCASRAGHSENYWTQMRFSRENPDTCPRCKRRSDNVSVS